MYTEFLLENLIGKSAEDIANVTARIEECTRLPDEVKKLTIAPTVLSANDAVSETFRNSLKRCRNFGGAGGLGEYPSSVFFFLPKNRFLATRGQEGKIKNRNVF